MKITQKKIADLQAYEWNNKTHSDKQLELLVNSIKEYGFNNPVIIDKDWVIVWGHWRVEAARRIWLEKVPCIEKSDLTELQIRKYRLLDNKIAELAEDKLDAIQIELEAIWDLELNDLYELKLSDNEEYEEQEPPEKKEKKCKECWAIQ